MIIINNDNNNNNNNVLNNRGKNHFVAKLRPLFGHSWQQRSK